MATKANVAVVSNDELRKIRGDIEKTSKPTREAAILHAADIERMRRQAKVLSQKDQAIQKKIAEEQKQSAQAVSKARKQKMVAADTTRATKIPKTEAEIEEGEKAEALLVKAQKHTNESHDDVKLMNKMVLYAKVVTVRDKQLDENKAKSASWKDEQRKQDLMMEINRLKALKVEEERDRLKVEAQRRGAAVIIEQISEREAERVREKKLREEEQRQMVRTIELQRQKDMEALQAKKERNAKNIAEVEASNRVALQKKQERLQADKDEEMKIFKYNREQIAKEEARIAEELRIKEEKELEIQRLRELQEKAADRQGEIDALRAKRAFEELERGNRTKERMDAEKRAVMAKDLDMSRKRQFLEKEIMLAQQAKAERDEFLRVIIKQKEDEENENKLSVQRHDVLKKHSTTIRDQIHVNTDLKKQERLDYLEEGRKVRQKIEDERLKVEGIKAEKLQGLKDIEISGKYMTDLAKKKIL